MSEVDTYIDKFDGEAKKRLLRLREIVRREVPEAKKTASVFWWFCKTYWFLRHSAGARSIPE
ncbi:MAG: hypothetical protein UY35_C0014G0021 [Candidatus Saccharibacteria bacterium GW2011_GWC2_48_9]|nr:MAG: hypothetical protein UY35_C0014G0021 [Candidatus Saccharibacteria bacterium GW2011_GWC2_48_9]